MLGTKNTLFDPTLEYSEAAAIYQQINRGEQEHNRCVGVPNLDIYAIDGKIYYHRNTIQRKLWILNSFNSKLDH